MSYPARKDTVNIGSNVLYTDIGVESAAEDALKLHLTVLLKNQIKQLRLTQTKAGSLMGVTQSDVSKLVRGRTEGFSLARVFAFVRALGVDVEIKVKTKPAIGGGRMGLHVVLETA